MSLAMFFKFVICWHPIFLKKMNYPFNKKIILKAEWYNHLCKIICIWPAGLIVNFYSIDKSSLSCRTETILHAP